MEEIRFLIKNILPILGSLGTLYLVVSKLITNYKKRQFNETYAMFIRHNKVFTTLFKPLNIAYNDHLLFKLSSKKQGKYIIFCYFKNKIKLISEIREDSLDIDIVDDYKFVTHSKSKCYHHPKTPVKKF